MPFSSKRVPEDFVVTGQDYDRVNIRVRGSRAGLASLTATDLVYVADLSGAESGSNAHEVDVTTIERDLPRGADVVSRAPLVISFDLEEKQTRSVAIELDRLGDLLQALGRGQLFPADLFHDLFDLLVHWLRPCVGLVGSGDDVSHEHVGERVVLGRVGRALAPRGFIAVVWGVVKRPAV